MLNSPLSASSSSASASDFIDGFWQHCPDENTSSPSPKLSCSPPCSSPPMTTASQSTPLSRPPSQVNVDIKHLAQFIFSLVGDFELVYTKDGRLTRYGTTGVSGDYQPDMSMPPHPNPDAALLSSDIVVSPRDDPRSCYFSTPNNTAEQPASPEVYDNLRIDSPFLHDLDANSHGGTTAAAMSETEVSSEASMSRYDHIADATLRPHEGSFQRLRRGPQKARKLRTMCLPFAMQVVPVELRMRARPLLERLWSLLAECRTQERKYLSIETLNTLRPGRRITHPFRGERPAWWPECVRFIDTSHLHSDERMALLYHMWLDMDYSDEDINSIVKVKRMREHFRPPLATRIFQTILQVRAIARQLLLS